MMTADQKAIAAPFPYFGGKSRVAARIWQRFGDVKNYVDPFCGSLAALLAAPYVPHTSTVNDADGMLANFWRAVSRDPDAVAHHADWPVNEIDLFARHVWLVKRNDAIAASLQADPDWFDAKAAGWWCWGACAWIGTGWCSGDGPWTVTDGQVVNIRGNAGRGVNRQLPHVGNAGRGVNRQLPHVGDAGRGVNRQLPHVGNAGQGRTQFIRDWMGQLCDRLRMTRVACGDWSRVVQFPVTTRHGLTAVLLDPPYGEGEMQYAAGGNDGATLASDVWEWAKANGNDPLLRIAVCGYADGREVPTGWDAMPWKAKKGYQATNCKSSANPHREVVWFSPHCKKINADKGIFAEVA